MTGKQRVAVIKKIAEELREHFESVRIVCTRTVDADDVSAGDDTTCGCDSGDSQMFTAGSGNYFAQRDSCREWIRRADERDAEDERQSVGDKDDGG